MLIIALGVLTLMAILGAAFASLIRLERKATENYIDARRMDLLLDSALNRVIAELQGAKNFRHFTQYTDTPWLYLIRSRSGGLEGDLAHGLVDVDDPRVGKWEVFADRAGQTYSFKTKIIDCSSQINLNGRQDTLARMLDHLGLAIERSSRLKLAGKTVRNPLHTRPNGQGDLIRGTQLLQFRQRLPGALFSSKLQLKLLIGEENYNILKDFVTVSSWEDPFTYKPTDGLTEVPDASGVTATAGGGRGLGGAGQGQEQPAAYGIPRLDSEPRHPVNINTAPEEVLIACLQGLAGRRVFPYSKLGQAGGGMQAVDAGSSIAGEKIIAQEEVRDVTPRAVFVYSPPLEYDHAEKLAERIIQQRKTKPFMTWRSNDPGQPGFEDFIDALDSSFFPSPTLCQAIDPEAPQNRQVDTAIIRAGGNEQVSMSRLWVKGHGQGIIRQTRQGAGLAFHETNAWYFDLIKGVIKSNFNPNSRINRYNPNSPAYIPVDKSDLVWARDRFNLLKGHTTEFCFDTNGIYEVTTLGRIASKAKGAGPRTLVAGAPPESGIPTELDFDRKTRTVVKLFDVLRHTNQFHFEKTFVSRARSSANDRKFVVTWPDPMAALTELVSGGSQRDGRVELAGLLDGRRLEAPLQQRFNLARTGNQAVVMMQNFQDRDAASIARIKRVTTQGAQSLLGDEYSASLRDVLDAQFCRLKMSVNRRYLRRAEMVSVGSPAAQILDPLVNREVLGTDLFPDGLNMSLLRASHLQARVLALPARQRIGDSSGGGGNPIYGASGRGSRSTDVLGNVPYHRGGIAFWVKFDFDGDDPVFSGLIGCTQVIEEVPASASDYSGSEGTQFFIFKNSMGELRVVRMYYHQAFPALASGDGATAGGGEGVGIRLFPDPGAGGGGGAPGERNPILEELDEKKVISRSDLVVNIRHFRAHEWHHIALDWDDQNPVYPIRLYLDFQEVKEGGAPRKAQAVVDATANSWVRLNERQPRDGLQVGGIIREQGVPDGGVFKWFTSSSGSGSQGGVKTEAPSVKRILANATIDELVTHNSTFLQIRQFYSASGTPGYFSVQPGEYANLFEIPLPPDVDHVILRSFDWTSYYPTTYTDSLPNSSPQRLPVTPITCELTYDAGSAAVPPIFSEPWRQPTVANQVAGRAVYRMRTGLKGNNAELVYKFKMPGARSQQGNSAGGVVQTPVIDDVTLTYFLPSPRILLQEEDE
ncbi:MAG TPA: hypothetical protein VMT52_18510 [Planctomycetota bacterium]|nr:hypothetical protein [Planctomycetota bacterium]